MDADPRDAIRRRLLGAPAETPELRAMHEAYVDWLLDESGPDDRHRVMMGWNWDEPLEIPTWIIRHPRCDKATLLLAFWNAQPEYDLRYGGDRAAVPDFELDKYDFAVEARRLFQAGAWAGAEIAFSLDDPCTWPRDFPAIDAEFGDLARAELPEAMRAPALGRELDARDIIEGIPARFWPERLR